jgi:Fe-S cluster assembly protein SufD
MEQFLNSKTLTVRENEFLVKGDATGIIDLAEFKSDTNFTVSENGNVKLIATGSAQNKTLKFLVKSGATLDLALASFDSFNKVNLDVELDEGASFTGAFADFTVGENHSVVTINLNGRQASATWHLASLAKDDDKKSFTVYINHNAKETYSNSMNYGVCENRASLDFLGASDIKKNSSKCKAYQAAKIMVFDPECKAKASPILGIGNNDVEAAHSAVCGQINGEHIYYLTSRGISEKDAKRLITLGYLNPIIKYFEKDEDTVTLIKNKIEER